MGYRIYLAIALCLFLCDCESYVPLASSSPTKSPVIQDSSGVKVSWDANIEADLAGYKIYYGKDSGSYQSQVSVGNIISYQLSGFEAGKKYYFAVTALDSSGNESGFSDEVSIIIIDSTSTKKWSIGFDRIFK